MSLVATTSDYANAAFPALRAARAIAINHVGFEVGAPKKAVLCLGGGLPFVECSVCAAGSEKPLFEAEVSAAGEVDNWQGQSYQEVDFSDFNIEGDMVLVARDSSGAFVKSKPFAIGKNIYASRFSAAILEYFKSQRCSDEYDKADRAISIVGNKRQGTFDVHGGWYDASGDVSKYLSHLSYANFMNPQQTPLFVWALCEAAQSKTIPAPLHDGFTDEALWGADFLVRMHDPEGMFYMTVFDKWSGDVAQREICSYSTQQGHKHDDWEAGFRQGGGMAIAALARAARLSKDGAFSRKEYLEIAEQAFAHLKQHNLEYLNDGTENIIDDYCALMAATELFNTTANDTYRKDAQKRSIALMARLGNEHGYDGWWHVGESDARPFFHAAEEGLPILALSRYFTIAPQAEHEMLREHLRRATTHIERVTSEVFNPFQYPRQFVKASDGALKTQFFFPHVNESGYWWQGENARLASLAYAFRVADPLLNLVQSGDKIPQNCMDWILGCNPYHTCMLQGFGHNSGDYMQAKFPNVTGGICNGITSAMLDEADVAFCETEDPAQSWSWSEQWLPHAAWFLLALTQF